MQIIDTPSNETNDEMKKVWALFLQENEMHYIEPWSKFYKGGSKISFNLGAAVGGVLWAGYRKMYGFLFVNIILFMIHFPLAEKFSFFEDFPVFLWLVLLGNPIFFGLFGNYIYYKSATKKIDKALKFAKNKEQYLKNIGGVNSGYFILGPLLATIIMIILSFLFLITGLVPIFSKVCC